MARYLWTVGVLALVAGLVTAADDKAKTADKSKAAEDSPVVKKAREKLDVKVTFEFKDERLKDVLEEIKKQCELSCRLEVGVSGNQSFTYSCKDKPLKEALEELFKGRGLGYVVHRKGNATDRYEGWLDITQGDERGDPIVKASGGSGKTETKPATPAKTETPKKPATETKPTEGSDDQTERLAKSKLNQAKQFIEDGQPEDAKEYLEIILKKYPTSKAAEEAKTILGKLKKKS